MYVWCLCGLPPHTPTPRCSHPCPCHPSIRSACPPLLPPPARMLPGADGAFVGPQHDMVAVASNSGRTLALYETAKLGGAGAGAKPLYSAELAQGLVAAVYPGGWRVWVWVRLCVSVLGGVYVAMRGLVNNTLRRTRQQHGCGAAARCLRVSPARAASLPPSLPPPPAGPPAHIPPPPAPAPPAPPPTPAWRTARTAMPGRMMRRWRRGGSGRRGSGGAWSRPSCCCCSRRPTSERHLPAPPCLPAPPLLNLWCPLCLAAAWGCLVAFPGGGASCSLPCGGGPRFSTRTPTCPPPTHPPLQAVPDRGVPLHSHIHQQNPPAASARYPGAAPGGGGAAGGRTRARPAPQRCFSPRE